MASLTPVKPGPPSRSDLRKIARNFSVEGLSRPRVRRRGATLESTRLAVDRRFAASSPGAEAPS